MEKEDLEKARAYALRLLDYRERSRQEIEERMRRRGYKDRLIEDVLQYLESHNFLNERRFIQIWGENRIRKGYGRKRIYFELRQKGLEEDLIGDVLDELYSDVDEVKIAKNLVRRRKFFSKGPRKLATRRLFEFLRRRGFSLEVIGKVMAEMNQMR